MGRMLPPPRIISWMPRSPPVPPPCASCPAGLPVLLMEMEAELKRHVPEVEFLEAVP